MEELQLKIKEYALENAIKFNGKAGQGAVIGKLMASNPDLKQQMKEVAPLIGKTIAEVNKLSIEEQKEQLLKLNPDFEKEQQEKKAANKEARSDLPPLKDAIDGKVLMRIAPEPSKYNHIGHAMSFLINYMYVLRHKGKCILRFDDTNPEKESQEYVDAMQEDVINYLDIKVDKTVFASDRTEDYIKLADKLIEEDLAYTCNCEQSDISAKRRAMEECGCRNKPIEENKSVWKNMQGGSSNDILRLKIDMAHKNAVMRDPVIFRVITTEHYRQKDKFKVWPMYDFECAIIEGELGITHVLRSNEFDSRIELQNHIREMCGFTNHPVIKQYARFEVTGAITQGREIREKIESGEVSGWDDPRLVTLKALKRRGIVKDAYYELAKVVGMSKTNSKLDFSVIASINRKLLDASAKRFFCIIDPVEIEVKGAPKREIELPMHPHLDLGTRKFSVDENYFIEKEDKSDKVTRLIDNFTFKGNEFISIEHSDKSANMIQFLPKDNNQIVNIEIKMPDNKDIKAIAEKNIESLKVNEVIQFQRFGFCRLDEIKDDGTRVFWYTHD